MEKQRIDEIAANRLKLITPHQDTALHRDKKQMLKEQIPSPTCLVNSLVTPEGKKMMEISIFVSSIILICYPPCVLP